MNDHADLIARMREHGWSGCDEAATVIAALVAENAKLRAACASGWGEPTLINTLRAERDEAVADAERYRWVKDHADLRWEHFQLPQVPFVSMVAMHDQTIDAAIDAARAQEHGGEA